LRLAHGYRPYRPIALALLVWRTIVEDRMLQRDLLGYADYAACVPYRLLPGVW
jgi:protein-S-isoprenylcysteine O-methyltransferase Ste14